jgi:hypothetical protein
MTLIASFEYQHAPILIGDLLITSPGASSKEAATPLIQSPNKLIGTEAQLSVSFLRQKVAILHDHVCLAWSGSLVHAQSYAEYMRQFLSGRNSIEYGELRAVVEAYPQQDVEGHLEFVIYSWHGNGWGYFSNLKPFDLGLFTQIRVSGSGTAHFIRHIEGVGRSMLVGDLDAYTELAFRALTYASLASAHQLFGAIGLKDGWGGGFEVAVRRDDRFIKLGPICWLFWECTEISPNRFRLELRPSFMYQFYVDETAMFWIDVGEEGGTNELHAIPPPFHTVEPQMLRPKVFETDILVNIGRAKMLSGNIYDGCNVDTSKGPGDRNLTITLSEEDRKTVIKFNDAYLQRLLRPMPIPNESEVEVKIWGSTIRYKRSG